MHAEFTSTPALPADAVRTARVVLPSAEFDATLAFLTKTLGFRLDSIHPADSPSVATLSGHGLGLVLERTDSAMPLPVLRIGVERTALGPDGPRTLSGPGGLRVELVDASVQVVVPEGRQEFVVTRLPAERDGWGVGRAGMLYRDLIPGRLGGRFIASHISIPNGGPVPDYVHYHHVRFQLIFCKAGWVRVVYQDQGPAFLLHAGDCVLQPPGIRHRVLEASRGLEVIEIGCPAVHETHVDHALALPTPDAAPGRRYGGQSFVRHVAADASWAPALRPGWEARDSGIAVATDGLAAVRVLRAAPNGHEAAAAASAQPHDGEFLFLFALDGAATLDVRGHGTTRLQAGDSCVVPASAPFTLLPVDGAELLEVALPARVAA